MNAPKKSGFEPARFAVGAVLALVTILLHAFIKEMPLGAWFVVGLAFGVDSSKMMPWKK